MEEAVLRVPPHTHSLLPPWLYEISPILSLSLLWLQVKIQGQNKEMLAAACQMFLGKTEAEIAHIALETLEGHQRAIMAHMTVEVGLGEEKDLDGM
jgi:hypothetical protein